MSFSHLEEHPTWAHLHFMYPGAEEKTLEFGNSLLCPPKISPDNKTPSLSHLSNISLWKKCPKMSFFPPGRESNLGTFALHVSRSRGGNLGIIGIPNFALLTLTTKLHFGRVSPAFVASFPAKVFLSRCLRPGIPSSWGTGKLEEQPQAGISQIPIPRRARIPSRDR